MTALSAESFTPCDPVEMRQLVDDYRVELEGTLRRLQGETDEGQREAIGRKFLDYERRVESVLVTSLEMWQPTGRRQ